MRTPSLRGQSGYAGFDPSRIPNLSPDSNGWTFLYDNRVKEFCAAGKGSRRGCSG
jgi:hypothetical protein